VEVGDSALYLLSHLSRGVTGEVHHVDSGARLDDQALGRDGRALFLENSRFQKAFCHKMLGQKIEMLKEKKMISAHKTFFVGNKDLGVRDLD
jgi:hypothetical protein